MFSNSKLEIAAKDELLNMNNDIDKISDHYEKIVNQFGIQNDANSLQKNKQIQDDSIYNSIKILNSSLNCQIENMQSTDKKIKEEYLQNFNDQFNGISKIGSKTIDNSKRKVMKQEGLGFLKSARENKIISTGTKGSISQLNYYIQDSQVNLIGNTQSQNANSIGVKQNMQGINSFKKGQSKFLDVDDEDENISICLSQVYQKREKIFQEQYEYESSSKSKDRKQKCLDQQFNQVLNSQNKSFDANTTSSLNTRQQQQVQQQNKNNTTIKNQQQIYNESYSNKKSNDIDNQIGGENFLMKRNIICALNRLNKQSFDFSQIQTTPNKTSAKNQNQCSPLLANSISKENQLNSSQYGVNSSNLYNNGIFSSSQILSDYNSKIDTSKQDPQNQSKERWNDKFESDYINFLSKNNKGQNINTIDIKRNHQQTTNIQTHLKIHNSIFLNSSLKESFIDSQKTIDFVNQIVEPIKNTVKNNKNISSIFDQNNNIDLSLKNTADLKKNSQEIFQKNFESQKTNVEHKVEQKQINNETLFNEMKIKQGRGNSKNKIQHIYNDQEQKTQNHLNNMSLVFQIQQTEQEQKNMQAFSADPSKYKKVRNASQNTQSRNGQKEITPLRNNKRPNQPYKRRKSIQILKKFDPNYVNIDAIKNECSQDIISESVQKFFESKHSQKQQYSQNSQMLNTQYSQMQINNTQEQIKDEFDDSSLVIQNQQITNRINRSDDQIKLNNEPKQSQRNIVEGSSQLICNQSIMNDSKVNCREGKIALQTNLDCNNISLPQQKQSLFYNYLEYKQFKSKLDYEKEKKKREKQKKQKYKNKSPLSGISNIDEQSQIVDKKRADNSFNSIQNISQFEDISNSQNILSGRFDQQHQSQQTFLEGSPQVSNQQKKANLNINAHSFQFNGGFNQPFFRGQNIQQPQTANNMQTDKRRIKLNQFSLDNRQLQNIYTNSCQNNYQNSSLVQQNQINKLPQIQKKFLF